MDSRDHDDRLLAAFLAGDLDSADERRWDEHLLECEGCWRAVREDRAGRQAARRLRQPAPAGLADRLAFAVEVAAAGRAAGQRHGRLPASTRRPGRRGRRPRRRLANAVALTAAVAAAVTLIVVLLPGGQRVGGVPAAVAAVARYAQAIPAPALAPHHGRWTGPTEVGRPVTMTAGGQRIVLRTWRVGGLQVVVAVSGSPFPMPSRSRNVPGPGMAWFARLGRLGLYCINGPTSELVAAPAPAAELAVLAARLPLGDSGG